MIKCFYAANKPNYGDMLTPIILKWISGETSIHVKGTEEGKLLCIGSGMNRWLRKNDIVWGYGSRNTDKHGRIIVPAGIQFLAVRGRMTRDNILKDNHGIEVTEVYGDPASLMPLIYKPKVKKEYEVGLIPHYIDKSRFHVLNPKIKIINVFDKPYKIIDDINKCNVIISTSLHGTITAEAYGIPVVWLQASNKVIGGWFKFNDYFSGTGRGIQQPIDMTRQKEINSKDIFFIKKNILPPPTFDTDSLIKAWKRCDIERIKK